MRRSFRLFLGLSCFCIWGCSGKRGDTGSGGEPHGTEAAASGETGSPTNGETNGPSSADASQREDDTSGPRSPDLAPSNGETPSQPDGSGTDAAHVSPSDKTNRLDLLLVVDNTANMPEKAEIFAESVRYLLRKLVQPPCVGSDGVAEPPTGGTCPSGTTPLHSPVEDVHVGVITTSLGGYGARRNCAPTGTSPETSHKVDGAHLMGSLERGRDLAGGDFLAWQTEEQEPFEAFETNVEAHIRAAGEHGCGYEGQLEAWLRFLVDPSPYTAIVRQNCSESDTTMACNGPERGADGLALVDETLLAQRAAFLRPDSLVAIVVLTDENDCSMQTSGQTWLVTDQQDLVGMYRGTAACEVDPNDPCCRSCGVRDTDGCPTDEAGLPVGCEEPTYTLWGRDAPSDDSPNLRCFHQKRRFGLDFLFPVERYVNALTQSKICPGQDTLTSCQAPVDNPLWISNAGARPRGRVFLTTIAGVPWQDLAVDVDADTLTLRTPSETGTFPALDWDLLLGARDANSERLQYPLNDGVMDPLLFESVEPRTGVHPPTGAPLAPPDSEYLANPVNGHEWNIADRASLQFACIFPLPSPETCLTAAQQADLSTSGAPVHACECGHYGNDEYRSPLCQDEGGEYGLTKRFSSAFPATRLLQVHEAIASNASVTGVVGSVCPRSMNESTRDFGYRPAMDALLSGLSRQLE